MESNLYLYTGDEAGFLKQVDINQCAVGLFGSRSSSAGSSAGFAENRVVESAKKRKIEGDEVYSSKDTDEDDQRGKEKRCEEANKPVRPLLRQGRDRAIVRTCWDITYTEGRAAYNYQRMVIAYADLTVEVLPVAKPSSCSSSLTPTAMDEESSNVVQPLETFRLGRVLKENEFSQLKGTQGTLVCTGLAAVSCGYILTAWNNGWVLCIHRESGRIARLSIGGNLYDMDVYDPLSEEGNHGSTILCCGGKANDVKVFDLYEDLKTWEREEKLVTLSIGENDQSAGECDDGEEKDEMDQDIEVPVLKELKCDPVFKAKNVSNNMVDLEVPVWISKVRFIRQSALDIEKRSFTIAVCSYYRDIKLYRTTVKRRPVNSLVVESDHPITCMEVCYPEGNELGSSCLFSEQNVKLILGNAVGKAWVHDVDSWKVCGAFRGSTGSIRSVSIVRVVRNVSKLKGAKSKSSSGPLVASTLVAMVGLDRILKIYDLKSRSVVAKVYLKQRMNMCMFGEPVVEGIGEVSVNSEGFVNGDKKYSRRAVNTGDEDNEDVDTIFNKLQTVGGEHKTKKKKKRVARA
eukprot:Nk52_evm49s745 gene=Nk52_evmTU49s745